MVLDPAVGAQAALARHAEGLNRAASDAKLPNPFHGEFMSLLSDPSYSPAHPYVEELILPNSEQAGKGTCCPKNTNLFDCILRRPDTIGVAIVRETQLQRNSGCSAIE